MATKFSFDGKIISLPGVYSNIKSGINNAPLDLSFGNILIVDNDATRSFGGGSGVNGEDTQGEDSIYTFDRLVDFRSFVRGGQLWDLALPLFRPFGSGQQGVSKIHYVRALTTTAAIATFTLDSGSGAITFNARNEGLCGNGVEVDDVLSQGYAWTISAGVTDPAKFIFKFYRGLFTGLDSNGIAYDNLSAGDQPAELLTQSTEVASLTELKAWADNNFNFRQSFTIGTFTVGNDTILAADVTGNVGNQLFAGGSQTTSTADLDDALEAVTKLDYTFILGLDGQANVASANNLKLLFHIENDAKYQKYLIVGGGNTKTNFVDQSITPAGTFNSNRVILVHGGCYVADQFGGSGLREKDSIYKAAFVLGRMCGLEPQIPITFKGLGFAGEVHKVTEREKERALDAGVLTTYYDSEIAGGIFAITQGINTLRNNTYLVNQDGTSHLVSLERIAAQLNKEIEVNAKNTLLGNQSVGPNRATLSEEVVKTWVEGYLRKKEATPTADNLIISFQDVTVETIQDAIKIRYSFEPNFEINKIFITGLIIDPNS